MSSKYGVVVHSTEPSTLSWDLQQLNADWYINFSEDVSGIPAGKQKPVYITMIPNRTLLTNSEIQQIADTVPGAIWYVGGEPNIPYTVSQLIEDLRYYYTEIKIADPTARITSPSVLNWEYTCVGCAGFQSGKAWITELVTLYQDLYGEFPPWDIWAIDLYPVDWWNLPNTGFEPATIQQYLPDKPPDSESVPARQLQGFRAYIDSLPGKSGQPIIVTELGIHWGWTGIQSGVEGCSSGKPSGTYKPLVIVDYFDSIFNWLENNAVSYNIERWFTYVTYSDITQCRPSGYAGMSLFDGPGAGAQLSDIGRWYVARSAP